MLPNASIWDHILFLRQIALMGIANQVAIWEMMLEANEEVIRAQVEEQWQERLHECSVKVNTASAGERHDRLKEYGKVYDDYLGMLCNRLDKTFRKRRRLQVWFNGVLVPSVRDSWRELDAGEAVEMAVAA